VCIDELKGRCAALAAGLQITGALGLLARAKRLGFVPALRPLLNAMTRSGIWYDPALIARVLAGVGE
jgi:predicted nucleic acid-binding protein